MGADEAQDGRRAIRSVAVATVADGAAIPETSRGRGRLLLSQRSAYRNQRATN
jgi:hypothetical protein